MSGEAHEPAARPEAPLLLVTKLHAPFVSAQAIVRQRLFDRLDDGRGRRLTLVACPAGFGKSTMAAAWCEREAERRPGAWVTLDEGDNDAVVLWSHVLEALRRACPGLDDGTLAGAIATSPLMEVVLPRLVNALAEQGELVLVLDDFHRLSGEAARTSVAWFVERIPASVQLVLLTRADPALPLGALRGRGQLLELRADDLRFAPDEVDAFLNGRLELGLAAADVELLAARTEGWPAGIYLAALSLAGREDKAGLVRAFDGTSTHVVEYLAAEVLAAFDPGLQHFMIRTSVLERLCPELCDAVLVANGSAAALEALAHTNLFLLPLDDRRRWFRFHHLFAQILRLELDRREPGAATVLHRRAYAWHAASGTTDEAIHHATAAGAFAEAAALIAETWVQYVNAGRTASVLEWLGRLPRAAMDANPRLLLVKAWACALRGREADMRDALARLDALGPLEDGALPDGFASLASSRSCLRAAFAWGDVETSLEHGLRSAELEGLDAPWRPVVSWSIGWAHYVRGDLELAERWLTETAALAPAAGQWIVGLGAMADLSILAGRRGLGSEALRRATETLELARECGLADACEVGEVHTALGLALAADGRPAQALEALEQGVFLRRLWGQRLDLVDALIALGAVAAQSGDPSRASAVLDEAQALVAGCASAGELPARLAEARRAVIAGPPTAVTLELSDRERDVLRLLDSRLTEREIAGELYISFNTVHSHVKSLYRKLGVSSRAEAVAKARAARSSPR